MTVWDKIWLTVGVCTLIGGVANAIEQAVEYRKLKRYEQHHRQHGSVKKEARVEVPEVEYTIT